MLWMYHGALRGFRVSWSEDSRWIAFAGDQENRFTAIELYDTKEKELHQVTRGYFNDDQPTFDPSGKYLYFLGSTDFALNSAWLDMSAYDHPTTRALYAAILQAGDPSPFLPTSDEEAGAKAPENVRRGRFAEALAQVIQNSQRGGAAAAENEPGLVDLITRFR